MNPGARSKKGNVQMNRRNLAATISLALTFPSTFWRHAGATQGTPAPGRDIFNKQSGESLFGDVILDHYRVIDNTNSGVLVLGAFVNTGTEPVDVPELLNVTVRDRDGVILGSGFLQADYPIFPPGEKIGFQTWVFDAKYAEVDPESVTIESSLGLQSATRQVEYLAEHKIVIEKMEELSRSDENLVIECVVTNASGSAFAHGLAPNFSVWDSAGLYCGHAFDNVMMRIPAGDSVRFQTHSGGSMINPLEISGRDFTWTPWITPK